MYQVYTDTYRCQQTATDLQAESDINKGPRPPLHSH